MTEREIEPRCPHCQSREIWIHYNVVEKVRPRWWYGLIEERDIYIETGHARYEEVSREVFEHLPFVCDECQHEFDQEDLMKEIGGWNAESEEDRDCKGGREGTGVT